ncbi:Uu.00g128850.m01.CDS01 [Anthostomella pinea]|uniref:Uu.00g128850.m01.CDS01 n=1 Tax=Anthostomella pinea TaxID=933095 RepID=A0AAI8YI17_9PEZI|nr:Uu.00g128850.m01.CDS01 [Anthostomella pinea]
MLSAMASQAPRVFPVSKVLAVAAALRKDGASPSLCFGTDEKPIDVGQCQIYAVKFPDGETWAIRIPWPLEYSRGRDGDLPELNLPSCVRHRELVPRVVHETLESSLFAISHGNLAAHKIIDHEYNITGIIGWFFARFCPLQLALRLPRFLAIDPDPPSELLADRQIIISHLSAIDSQPDSLASLMKTVLSAPNVDWQDLVYNSCFSKGLHRWMSERSWFDASGKEVTITSENTAQ